MTPTFKAKILKGKIEVYDKEAFEIWKAGLDGEEVEFQVVPKPKDQRTISQNSAMHLFFEQVAEALNDAGYDMRHVLKPEVEIPWTKDSVKNHLWKPVQTQLTHKDSTTELLKVKEIDMVYDVLNRFLALKGIHINFPSYEKSDIS